MFSLPSSPSSPSSLLVRTDFTSDEAWAMTRAAAEVEGVDGFLAGLEVVDDETLDGPRGQTSARQPLRRQPGAAPRRPVRGGRAGRLRHRTPPCGGRPRAEDRAPFRCIARELWSVENNLNLANMDWEDVVASADPDGTFRGFG